MSYLIDTLVPGTRKTYQEILVLCLRDYVIEQQIPYTKIKWANVVNFIRVIFNLYSFQNVSFPFYRRFILKLGMAKLLLKLARGLKPT